MGPRASSTPTRNRHWRSQDARPGQPKCPPTLADIALDVEIASPSPEREVRAVIQAWVERCPIYLALTKPTAVATTFTVTRG
jgi:uncharacterized OsmC-like protein